MSAHRPMTYGAAEPEPWSVAGPATEPDRPGRYQWIAPERGHAHPSAEPRSGPRPCRRTDPCIVPPPGSDRRGAEGCVRVVEAGASAVDASYEGKE